VILVNHPLRTGCRRSIWTTFRAEISTAQSGGRIRGGVSPCRRGPDGKPSNPMALISVQGRSRRFHVRARKAPAWNLRRHRRARGWGNGVPHPASRGGRVCFFPYVSGLGGQVQLKARLGSRSSTASARKRTNRGASGPGPKRGEHRRAKNCGFLVGRARLHVRACDRWCLCRPAACRPRRGAGCGGVGPGRGWRGLRAGSSIRSRVGDKSERQSLLSARCPRRPCRALCELRPEAGRQVGLTDPGSARPEEQLACSTEDHEAFVSVYTLR